MAVHPAIDDAEFLAIEPGGNHERQSDLNSMVPPKFVKQSSGKELSC